MKEKTTSDITSGIKELYIKNVLKEQTQGNI